MKKKETDKLIKNFLTLTKKQKKTTKRLANKKFLKFIKVNRKNRDISQKIRLHNIDFLLTIQINQMQYF